MNLAACACGMVTALGFNAPASLAALRAGLSGVREAPVYDFEAGGPFKGAKVPLPQWWEGLGKLADLVAPAIHECLADAPVAPETVPLLVAVSAPGRPGRPPQLDGALLDEVAQRLQLPRHPQSRLFAEDETGAFDALLLAERWVADGTAPFVVVAGVDSFVCQPTLVDYAERRRVATDANSNGFLPGEAGCALLVCAPGASGRDELRVLGAGRATEKATIDSTEPLRADGLTAAMKSALERAGVALNRVAYRLTDLTGEHYRFKEAAIAAGRLNGGERDVPLDLWHPIESFGAIGAAILPCLMAQAMHSQLWGYAPGPLALCHAGNEAGMRVALVVTLRTATARSDA